MHPDQMDLNNDTFNNTHIRNAHAHAHAHDFYKVVSNQFIFLSFVVVVAQTDDWKSKTRKSHHIITIIESSNFNILMGNTSNDMNLFSCMLVYLCVCLCLCRVEALTI